MNGKDLLMGLGNISHKYYEEGENATPNQTRKSGSFRRHLLVAAVIALTLLLVGCAVAYVLRLQDMSIGQETYTQTFDDQGLAIEPTEKTRDIITIYGHSGDPIQKALAEWLDYLNTYDPEGKLVENHMDNPEIPNAYEYTYSCYTADMVNKVDEIAGKYQLNLLEESLIFQQYHSQIFYEETGISSFLLPDSEAELIRLSGMYYPPYNFEMDFTLSADNLSANLYGTVIYARKDYFPHAVPAGMDLSQFAQWDHTAPDGTKLLLALNTKGTGFIIAEPAEAMLILQIEGNYSGSAYPQADEVMTQAELESVADLFDYSVCPKAFDRGAVEQKLAQLDAAQEALNAYVPERYGSYNEYLQINVGIYDAHLMYTFYDLTGDGAEDLLIGKNGAFEECLYLQDGQLQERQFGNTYVCADGILEDYAAYEIFEDHTYVIPNFSEEADTLWTTVESVNRTRDQWRTAQPGDFEGTQITEAQAQAIMEKYPRVKLEWKPLMAYPLSETQTLGDYLKEKDVRLSGEALREVYREYLLSRGNLHYSHYRLLDINGDGVEDLLLKGQDDSFIGKTDYYWIALTYRYGAVFGFASDFYLCEDGVLEVVDTRHAGGFGVEKNGHQFMKCVEFSDELYELVVYNKSTGSWQTDWWDDEPISQEQANAILAKYPRMDQGMLPIEDLLK